MRLLIIRHGDPDYERDTLTEKGCREAELLADRLVKIRVKDFYVSPLGRAKDTASLTLKRLNRTAVECEWLREFSAPIHRPDAGDKEIIPWDWLPADWTKEECFFRRDSWHTQSAMAAGQVGKEYERVTGQFDALLARHGYEREGSFYRVKEPNRDTLVFFCHFGLECVLLSHLTHLSPMILWHHFCAAPTSVTSVYTEERREGIASFRISCFGDLSHLYAAGEEPSNSARFCETFQCREERHD